MAFLKIGIRIFLMIYIIGTLSVKWGWGGFFLGSFIFVIIIILMSRNFFMYVVRETEEKLFGKPLNEFEKGEFKRPKIVWSMKKPKEKK